MLTIRSKRTFVLPALCLALLALAATAGAQSLGDNNGLPSWSVDELALERYAQARHEADLLARPGVLGVGIGLTQGPDGERPALVVLVDEQVGAARLGLPSTLEGVPVRVETVAGGGVINGGNGCSGGTGGCHDALFAKPIPMGTSTSSILACDAGTLGFKACDATNGYPGYVTAMHVATRDASFCEARAPLLTEQVHRGKYETSPACTANYVIGGLDRYVPPAATGNLVDAAFVRSNDSRTAPTILDTHTPLAAYTPTLGTCVAKSGRTTGYTPARIDMVNMTWSVYGYCLAGSSPNQYAQFTGVFRFGYDNGSCGTCANPPCWDVALGGDSGSAVVHPLLKGRLYGLLFANVLIRPTSDPDGNEFRGIAAPAATVLSELDLNLCH